jgi:NADH:ubiquinone oxidoreductase subunit 6 (subunit J)
MSQPLLLEAAASFRTDQLGPFLQAYWPAVLSAALGMVAVYLLLPRTPRYPPLWGAAVAALSLVLAGYYLIHAEVVLEETILFYAFAGIAVLAGGLMVTQSNPAYAALSFALVVLSSCGLFLLQAAPFLMAATVIIYAGAIVVTFLFVLMLAQQAGVSNADQRSREPLLACVAGFVLLAALLCVLQHNYDTSDLDKLQGRFDAIDRALQADTAQQIRETLGNDFLEKFLQEANQEPYRDRYPLLAEKITNAQPEWTSPTTPTEKLKKALAEIRAVGERARYLKGSLQPAGKPGLLSELSGVAPNRPVEEIPRDAHGRPKMPAENVAALGRALFTDYLLAVELAGTILLVATIGAIAIVSRRGEVLR